MLQKEKHEKIICEIALRGDTFGVSEMDNLPVACDSIRCENCLFYEIGCALGRQGWLNSEYTEPKRVFTEEQKNFIRACDDIKYIARDKSGSLFAYSKKPRKGLVAWSGELMIYVVINFPQITWEDKEPTSREEILGEVGTIEETSRAMSDFVLENNAKYDIELSKRLIAAGYRKQSDTAREIKEKIFEKGQFFFSKVVSKDIYEVSFTMTLGEFNKIIAQYDVEVEE